VERSIALAYEAVNHFPDRKVHITNELIHNPEVNDKLLAMNVHFIEKMPEGKKNFESVQDGDVVILPAFGASFEEMDYFDKKVRVCRHRIAMSVFNLFLTLCMPTER
jgi:4-hydroxy-3-methylbut-2-en-1-yl diphosphate reductase